MNAPELDRLVADARAELERVRTEDYTCAADLRERLAAAHEGIVDAYRTVSVKLALPYDGALYTALIDAQVLHATRADELRNRAGA